MARPLHIIEPTLAGDSGHCHSLVRALAHAARECDITVWASRAAAPGWPGPGRLVPHFQRRWRRLQAFWLYRRLLRQPGTILVATAGTADLVLADWAAPGRIQAHKLFMFVHWLGGKAAKARRLSAIARRQPNIEILAPTATVADFFAACGFRATLVPYPLALPDAPVALQAPVFRHLLVAGGARIDKGFDRVVDLVVEMQRRGLALPITVQTSFEARHQQDPALAQQINRLRAAGYGALTLCDQAMGPAAYRALFDGALVLQPYRTADFRDRVSGVTLDALSAGAPVVASDGTWMADLVRRFDAGVATHDLSPSGLLAAIHPVLADHAHFAARARAAAASVQADHSAKRLLDVVLQRA